MSGADDMVTIIDGITDPKNRVLMECMTEDINSHIRAIKKLARREFLTVDDVHNLFVRWSITARAAQPIGAPTTGAAEPSTRENLLDKFARDLDAGEALRGRRAHPALSDPVG